MIKTITVSELRAIMEKGEVLLVDVREPAEHRSENIPGANLIPLSSISHDKLKSKSIFPFFDGLAKIKINERCS